MTKLLLAASAALLLSACGTQLGDRMASGAAIGGGAELIAGGVGAIPGAVIGAGVGAFTPPDKVNLGEPVWDDVDDVGEDRYDDQGNARVGAASSEPSATYNEPDPSDDLDDTDDDTIYDAQGNPK